MMQKSEGYYNIVIIRMMRLRELLHYIFRFDLFNGNAARV